VSTVAEAMEEMRLSIIELSISIRDQFTPAIEALQFTVQRIHVESLLAQPWYRHLRHRWALRHSPRWSDKYPAPVADGGTSAVHDRSIADR